MSQVAEAAGVSVSTVSHVVNGTRPVSSASRDKVLAAMQALGYRYRPAARSLGVGGSRTIGFTATAFSNPFWAELVAAIDNAVNAAGMQLLIVDTQDDPRREARAVANLLAHHVDGLVMAPSAGWRQATLPILRERAIPYVLIDRLEDVRVDQVTIDNVGPAEALVSHLLDLGHRRIGIVTGADGLSTSSERVEGFASAHRKRGLVVDPTVMVSGYSTYDGGAAAMASLLELPDPITAVFTANNSMTMGVMSTLKERGLRVPADLAVVCFDDHPWADSFEPGLTVVAQPNAAIGATAVQLLTRRLADEGASPKVVRLAGEIVHRVSCGCGRKASAPIEPCPAAVEG